MKILMINKFLYPNGGSETYIFKLGEYLLSRGHEVQYFGMEHEGRCVGNHVEAYTSEMNFHEDSRLKNSDMIKEESETEEPRLKKSDKLKDKSDAKNSMWKKCRYKIRQVSYAVRTIYSREARVQIRKVLDDFAPDVCHLNNFNYQLTPSIILEIVKWRRQTGHACRIVFTAHDYQLVCPNHMMNNPITHKNCDKCIGGHYGNCFRDKCIHGSAAKSLIGMIEAKYWNHRGTYRYIDRIICCSEFMKSKMDTNPIFADKTVTIHNFVDKAQAVVNSVDEAQTTDGFVDKTSKIHKNVDKSQGTDIFEDNTAAIDDCVDKTCAEQKGFSGLNDRYILYFGRYSREKGMETLIKAARQLPEVTFVCAGSGEYAKALSAEANITDVGFLRGEELDTFIQNAYASVYPSEWYENGPFSVMESQSRGVPVIGAAIGGIPELISDGVDGALFESGDADSLAAAIRDVWENPDKRGRYSCACKQRVRDDVGSYAEKLYEAVFADTKQYN